MDNLKIVFAGFGGQGILFSGKVAAYAGLYDDNDVSWLPSYGAEMRGGTATCSVCISADRVGSPVVKNPNVLVAMNSPSLNKYLPTVEPGGMVFTDSTLAKGEPTRSDVTYFEIPATRLANTEKLEGLANIILLGKVLKETRFACKESVSAALEKSVPPSKKHLLEHNLRAIELGAQN
jgi:2-oxoglutarate ferredoxin oxidoreductase subunit gamma